VPTDLGPASKSYIDSVIRRLVQGTDPSLLAERREGSCWCRKNGPASALSHWARRVGAERDADTSRSQAAERIIFSGCAFRVRGKWADTTLVVNRP
jgi:hypothetical protein